MGGWARIKLTVSPDGTAVPCPVASSIETLRFSTVREHRLEWIWYESPSSIGSAASTGCKNRVAAARVDSKISAAAAARRLL